MSKSPVYDIYRVAIANLSAIHDRSIKFGTASVFFREVVESWRNDGKDKNAGELVALLHQLHVLMTIAKNSKEVMKDVDKIFKITYEALGVFLKAEK